MGVCGANVAPLEPRRKETTVKSNDNKREAKKKPAMTMKEKKAAKNAKKAAKNALV